MKGIIASSSLEEMMSCERHMHGLFFPHVETLCKWLWYDSYGFQQLNMTFDHKNKRQSIVMFCGPMWVRVWTLSSKLDHKRLQFLNSYFFNLEVNVFCAALRPGWGVKLLSTPWLMGSGDGEYKRFESSKLFWLLRLEMHISCWVTI